MEYDYVRQLDDFFAEQYCDYVRICAIEGYRMPEMLSVDRDGNISRLDSKYMRLCYQSDCAELLKRFKAGLADTDITFDFLFPPLFERFRDRFRKFTFAKRLPETLKKYGETPERVGEKLTVGEKIWKGIVKGRLYPEKNTVMAIALVCRMQTADVNSMFNVCGLELKHDNVRDTVFEYLIRQQLFNEQMRDRCLAEYKIDTLPIRR